VTELRFSQSRLEAEAHETAATLESERDRAAALEKELDLQRMQLEELKQAQAVAVADDREKRKAEMLADMMAKIDTVRLQWPSLLHHPS
jgi:kinesin family protein 5